MIRHSMTIHGCLGLCISVAAVFIGASVPAVAQESVTLPASPQPGDVLALVQIPCDPTSSPHWMVTIGSELMQVLGEANDATSILIDDRHPAGFPGSSPLIIGVSPVTPADGEVGMASFSNSSPAVDILAPGGSLIDPDSDTYTDGIFDVTLDMNGPSQPLPVLCMGRSQATAVVQGALIALQTADPDQLRQDLSIAVGLIDGSGNLSAYGLTLAQPTHAEPAPDVSIGPRD